MQQGLDEDLYHQVSEYAEISDQLARELADLTGESIIRIEPVDANLANEALVCWRRFGKGRHPAGLNFGDTFSYALGRRMGVPLLFVGDDFSQTDVLVA